MMKPAAIESSKASHPEGAAGRKRNVALAGFGTVGKSVAKLLTAHFGDSFQIRCICNRNVARKKVDWLPGDIRWTENFDDALAADVDVVVELIGGFSPAGDWIRKALEAGKSVVTANKHLIAERGPELAKLAQSKGVRLEYGASVCGGIPVLSGLQDGLAGDHLLRIAGILNGTCNYILNRMDTTGSSFPAALKEAQGLGYAEADPTDDLEGYDARYKLVILARMGLGCHVRSEQIACRSIAPVEEVDFLYTRELDCTVRQISLAQRETYAGGLRLMASVEPTLVPVTSPLAHVQGNQNLLAAGGEFGGQTVFSGFGAGGNPTAVAVVSDLVAIARNPNLASDHLRREPAVPAEVNDDFTYPHYLRFIVNDRPGIIADIALILSRAGINIDAVLQKPGYPASRLPFVMTLGPSSTRAARAAVEQMARLDFNVQPPLCLPILA